MVALAIVRMRVARVALSGARMIRLAITLAFAFGGVTMLVVRGHGLLDGVLVRVGAVMMTPTKNLLRVAPGDAD